MRIGAAAVTSLDAAGAQCGQQSEGGEFGVLGSAPTAYQDSTRLRAHVDHGYFGIEGYSIFMDHWLHEQFCW